MIEGILGDSHTLVGGVCIIVGGIVTQIFNNLNKKTEMEHTDATQIRRELNIRCTKLEIDNSEWQKKYYLETGGLKERLVILEAKNDAKDFAIKQLEAKVGALSSQLDDLKTRSGIILDSESDRYK